MTDRPNGDNNMDSTNQFNVSCRNLLKGFGMGAAAFGALHVKKVSDTFSALTPFLPLAGEQEPLIN